MKKWFTITMLFLYLCSTTELYQFLKIPILVEHYLQHKSNNTNITLAEFLKMHYDHHQKDADWQQDQKLPFISHTEHLSLVFTVSSPHFALFFKGGQHILSPNLFGYNDAILDWKILDSIWQPPKFS